MSTNAIIQVPQPDTQQFTSSEISVPHAEQSPESSFIAGFLENKFVKRFIVVFLIDGSSVVHTFRLVLASWQVTGDYIICSV
jgi:hypothetical protein